MLKSDRCLNDKCSMFRATFHAHTLEQWWRLSNRCSRLSQCNFSCTYSRTLVFYKTLIYSRS